MVVSGIRSQESLDKRLKQLALDRENDLIQSMKVYEEFSSFGSLAGGGDEGTEGEGAGRYMPLSGGTFFGKTGRDIEIVEIIDDVIDVSKLNGNNSGFIVLNGEGGADDILDTIIPGTDVLFSSEFSAQSSNQEITIKNFTTGFTNIITPTGNDVILGLGEVVYFLYSQLLSGWILLYTSGGITKQTINGSRNGNVALADLLTKLEIQDLIDDNTVV